MNKEKNINTIIFTSINTFATFQPSYQFNLQCINSCLSEKLFALKPGRVVSCNCLKSQCLSNYCECYRSQGGCSESCGCKNCENHGEQERQKQQKKGKSECQCTTGCLSGYCICHKNGNKCRVECNCSECNNIDPITLSIRKNKIHQQQFRAYNQYLGINFSNTSFFPL